MGLSENLQSLRKLKNMSQEQLAEKLSVSRQAVSKWESGNGYPETEKLILICDLFECNMDTLLKGKITDDVTKEKKKYEMVQEKLSKGIALGVGLILLGVAILLFFAGMAEMSGSEMLEERYSILGVTILLAFIAIAVPIFIIRGSQYDNFKERYPKISNLYTEEEIEKFNSKYTIAMAVSVGLILLGVIGVVFLYGMRLVPEESTVPVVILMLLLAVSVPIFIYYGIQKNKYNIEKYNYINSEEGKNVEKKIDKVCGIIMLITTAIYLVISFVFNIWELSWLVFAIGGIACGIVSVALEKE